MSLKERAIKLTRDIPAVLLAAKDKDTPVPAKIIAGITVAYALSPIDLIPDFIPLLGYLDDILLLPALISLTVRLIPKDVLEKNRAKALALRSGSPSKKWYYALPIVLLWLLIIRLILRLFL